MTDTTGAQVASARCEFAHCAECGMPVHIHPDVRGWDIALQPGHHPAATMPSQIHRHLHHGIVQLGADPGDFGLVRIEHGEVCPARPRPDHPALGELWVRLEARRPTA